MTRTVKTLLTIAAIAVIMTISWFAVAIGYGALQDWQIEWGLGQYQVNADDNPTDTTNFNNALSAADDTVQKSLDTLDDAVSPTLWDYFAAGIMKPKTANDTVYVSSNQTDPIHGITTAVSGNGVHGESTTGDGVEGQIHSNIEGQYSLAARPGASALGRTLIGTYGDLATLINVWMLGITAPDGHTRVMGVPGGNVYTFGDQYTDPSSTGKVCDLGVQYRQVFHAAGAVDPTEKYILFGDTPVLAEGFGLWAFDSAVYAIAGSTITTQNTSTGPGVGVNPYFIGKYIHVEWTSVPFAEQNQFLFGEEFPRYHDLSQQSQTPTFYNMDRFRISARYFLNTDVTRFEEILLVLAGFDQFGAPVFTMSTDVLPMTTAGLNQVQQSVVFDTSAYPTAICMTATIAFRGTQTDEDMGLTAFNLHWIAVESWRK